MRRLRVLLWLSWREISVLIYLGFVFFMVLPFIADLGEYIRNHQIYGWSFDAGIMIKFYLDGDSEWATIVGTGTEDYFCGSYNFDRNGQYTEFSTAYSGLHQVIRPDGTYKSQQRFGMYRWHIMDPVRFEKDLRVTIQALGWRSGIRYLPLQDDIASTVFWYQAEPHAAFPKLPGRDELEVV